MFERVQALEEARAEWEKRKAAAAAFRAAWIRKKAEPVPAELVLAPGVWWARRRELELSEAYLVRLEAEAAAALDAWTQVRKDIENGVAEEI